MVQKPEWPVPPRPLPDPLPHLHPHHHLCDETLFWKLKRRLFLSWFHSSRPALRLLRAFYGFGFKCECVCRRSSPHLSCFYNLSFIQENEKEVLKMKMKLFQTCRRTLVLMYPFTMFCGDTNSFSSFSRKINQNILETVCSFESILTSICWQESTEISQKQKMIKKKKDNMVYGYFFLPRNSGSTCVYLNLRGRTKKKSVEREQPIFLWVTNSADGLGDKVHGQWKPISRVATLTTHLQILFYYYFNFFALTLSHIDTAANQAVLCFYVTTWRKAWWVFLHICQRHI